MIAKILCTLGRAITIGFGAWHFFVPKIHKWYSYIDSSATELVVAVRATNVFFSLSLVLIGVVNIVFAYGLKENIQSFFVMMIMSTILWLVRVVMQLVFPQGSVNPTLQYGMLACFVIVFMLFLISAILVYSNI